MISESLYFTLNGVKSSDFGIMNVTIQTGMYEESFMSSRSIKEFTIRGHEKPYFQEVTREPKSINLTFAFEETWDDELISRVSRWLDIDFYQPLSFSEQPDKVYYVMTVNEPTIIHNGLKQGYITLNMRCDSPYSYSHDIVSPWYDCVSSGTYIDIYNKGDKAIYSKLWIQKVGNGNLSIFNTSNGNEEFKFVGLLDNEEVYVDGENQIIETSLPNTWRYDNFNDFYLPLHYGKNTLKIVGSCKLKFQYKYKFII
ncbi:distal tail protein Dit [Neobacillus vireti]|uniref:distal tail protein Dit n=1 Tax=Neobacillus vireti TaxID=220686 RepID=UPI002FFF3C73